MALESYRGCLENGGILGCTSRYEEIVPAREKLLQAMSELEARCIHAGRLPPDIPQP